MIISLVSRRNGAGKTYAAQTLVRSELDFYKHSFAWNLSRVSDMFLGFDGSKYAVHPYLGVSKKDITNAVSKTLEDMHPELPVMLIKQDIMKFINEGHNVVIDDVRREREFKWLNMAARNQGTKHYIVEIVPTGDAEALSRADTWSNGMEPCGYEVWGSTDHCKIENDGTDEFERELIELVEWFVS